MNTLEELKKVLDEAYGEDLDVSLINADSDLRKDLGLNSVGMLAMAVAIEDRFNIRFDNEDFVKIIRISDLIEIIEKKL